MIPVVTYTYYRAHKSKIWDVTPSSHVYTTIWIRRKLLPLGLFVVLRIQILKYREMWYCPFFYGYDAWSLALGEQKGWRCLKTECWGIYLGPRGRGVKELKKWRFEELHGLLPSPNIIQAIIQVQGMRYVRGRSELSTLFWWENLKDRGSWEGLKV